MIMSTSIDHKHSCCAWRGKLQGRFAQQCPSGDPLAGIADFTSSLKIKDKEKEKGSMAYS
jgi:hypothetical protein